MKSLESGANTPSVNLVRTGPRGGDPVILIHPAGLDLTYWSAQIEALSVHHDVIAFDLPGHGRTPGVPQDWTIAKAAEFLEQVALSTGSDRVRLVGLSVGGIIAQKLAITRPELVSALVLIDTAAAFTDEGRAGMRKRAAAARSGGMAAVLDSTLERWFMPRTIARRPDLIERVTRTLLADDPAIHGAMWDMISALDLVSELHRVDCPTLIVVGEHDPSSPPAAARIMRGHIRGARMHVVDGASHMAPLERPVIVNELLLEFLSRSELPGQAA
jgi:3-oxoadipate enol-lactonase